MSATRRVIQMTDRYRESYSLYQSLVGEEGGRHDDLFLPDPDVAKECSVGELEVLNASISDEISRLKLLHCHTEKVVSQEECSEQSSQKRGTKRKKYPNDDDFGWVASMASNVDNAIHHHTHSRKQEDLSSLNSVIVSTPLLPLDTNGGLPKRPLPLTESPPEDNDELESKRLCLGISDWTNIFSPVKSFHPSKEKLRSFFSPIQTSPDTTSALGSDLLKSMLLESNWNPRVVESAIELLSRNDLSPFNRANRKMLELFADRYSSGSSIDEEYLRKIHEARVERMNATKNAGCGYTANMAPQVTMNLVNDLCVVNICHYSTNACKDYCSEEEKRNATFASYENGSLFWMPYTLTQIAHAHGKHDVTIDILKRRILCIDMIGIVFSTTTFTQTSWPEHENHLYRSEDVAVALFTKDAGISLAEMLVGTMMDIQLIIDLFVQEKNKPLPLVTISHRITDLCDLPTKRTAYDKLTPTTHFLCRQPHPSANWSFGDAKKTPTKKEYDKGLTLTACTLGCMDKSDEPLKYHEEMTKERNDVDFRYCKGGGGKDMQVSICTFDGCGKPALIRSNQCIDHAQCKICKDPDCTKLSLVGEEYCIALHGGGRQCSIEDCPRKAVGGTFCSEHGGQYPPPNGGQICSVEGCNEAVRARGKCKEHDDRICSVEGCDKIVRRRGKCKEHDICSVEGCNNVLNARGKCKEHDDRICSVEGCDKTVRGRGKCKEHDICSVEGCNKLVRAYGKCKEHTKK